MIATIAMDFAKKETEKQLDNQICTIIKTTMKKQIQETSNYLQTSKESKTQIPQKQSRNTKKKKKRKSNKICHIHQFEQNHINHGSKKTQLPSKARTSSRGAGAMCKANFSIVFEKQTKPLKFGCRPKTVLYCIMNTEPTVCLVSHIRLYNTP